MQQIGDESARCKEDVFQDQDCQRGFQPMLGVISKITKNMDKLSKCKRRCVNSVSCHFFKWKVIKVKY